MIVASGLIAIAGVIACVSWDAAPRPEAALPLRSRSWAFTGGAVAVDRVVVCGGGPSRGSARPTAASWLVCPKVNSPSKITSVDGHTPR